VNAPETVQKQENELIAAYRIWISALLAVYSKTGVIPSAYVQRTGNRLSRQSSDARQLAAELMWDIVGELPETRAWLEVQLGKSVRGIDRVLRQYHVDPIPLRVRAHCAEVARRIKPVLTLDLVRVAIEAGWTASETRGVKAVRGTHHLLRVAQVSIGEESVPPSRPVPRAEW